MDVDDLNSYSDDRPYAEAGGPGSIGSASGASNFEAELRVGGLAMRNVAHPSGQPNVELEHHRRHDAADQAENQAADELFGSEAPGSIAGDVRAHREAVHVACYPNFDASLLGEGIDESPPRFVHNSATIGGWVPFEAFDSNIRPKRTMVINIPAEFLKIGATRVQQFMSDQHGSTRIADTAALLSLIYAGYSKGFLSGRHCELAGLEDEADDTADAADGKKKKKKRPSRVDSYTYYPDGQAGTVASQVSVGYEELTSPSGDVLAFRVWLFIFDQEHSTSSLVAKVIREARTVHQHSKLNSLSVGARKDTYQKEQRNMRPAVMGYNMEDNSSIQYVRICDDAELLGVIRSYAGASTDNVGRPPLSADDESYIPVGTNLVPIDGGRSEQADGLGSTHPLSIEWVFNAKRPSALAAGLVGCDNQLLNICETQLDPHSYFDETGNLTMPELGGVGIGFWLQSIPTLNNIFDMVLPQALQGAIVPGSTLLGAFRELHRPDVESNDRMLVDCFRNLVTNTDMHQARVVAAMRQVVLAPDSINVSVEERDRIKHVNELLQRGPRFYGQTSESSDVIEPRNILKEVAREQSSIDRLVVDPWIDKRQKKLDQFELKILELQRDRNEKLAAGRRVKALVTDLKAFETKYNDKIKAAQAQLVGRRDELAMLKNQIRQELFEYGAARIKRAFLTKSEYDLMPRGYQAIWDGLHTELSEMPNKSACIASAFKGMQLVHSDRSVFGHITNWLGDFWENTAQIDGRDWRIMEQILLQAFDVLSDEAQIMLICGPKGNGKTHRTERAERMFSPGWFTSSGGGSAKAGMQGTSDADNGCVCVCDEMIQELIEPNDPLGRIEWWKQMCTKRQYVYSKPLAHKNASGMEYLRTVKLVSPNYKTYVICTNHGPAFTRKDDEPSEVKAALIDRSIVQFARTLGTTTRSTNELERNLLHPENANKVRTFRLLTTLTALVKMLIWRQSVFQPDFAMAQRMWDEWDRRLDQQYGLPRLTPRKNAKRINDCLTFTIMNAVACVFLYKQTACHFETYPLHDEEPIPFDVSQLWRCVQMLQPTPEIIHYAWTCSLEQMIGTSCMGLAALSAVCDLYGRKPGDLLRRPPAWAFSEMETLCKDLNEQKKNVVGSSKDNSSAAAAAAAAGVNNGFGTADSADHAAVVRNMTRSMSMRKRPRQAKQMFEGANELVPLFRGVDSEISKGYVARMRDMFRSRRQARVAYRMHNVEVTHSRKNFDSNAHIDETLEPKLSSVAHLGKNHHNANQHAHLLEHGLPVYEAAVVDLHPPPPNSRMGSAAHREMLSHHQLHYVPPAEIFGINEADPMDKQRQDIAAQERTYLHNVGLGVSVYNDNEDIDDYKQNPNFKAIHRGFQSRMAVAEGIDSSNCPDLGLECHDPSTCVFCNQNQSGPAQLISIATSTVWADGVEAACFYSLQNLCEFALNTGILIDKTSGIPGMRPMAREVAFKATGQMGESTGPSGGTTCYDLGWMCKHTHGSKSPWDRVARQMENLSWHLKAMDLHHEGIRDLLYLISMRDNARRVGVLPGISDLKSGMVDEYGHHPNDNSKLVRFDPKAPAPSFGFTEKKFQPNVFPPRHPASLVPDSAFQRACDARLASGQLIGLEVLSSANVIRSPPIRLNYEFMEASTTCMHDHVCLLVESSLSATLMPGLTNLQESFSGGHAGPEGFSSRTSESTKAKEKAKRSANNSSAEAASAATAEATEFAASSGEKGPQAALANSVASLSEVGSLPNKASDTEPPSKRAAINDDGRSVAEQTEASDLIPDGEGIHTLAYSYDVIQISIALDMSECLYDSTKTTRLASQQSSTTHKLVENEHHLAHISLRFPGYEAFHRQTISMPVQTKPMADIMVPEDAIESNQRISRRHVSLVIGRHATEADVQAYVGRLSGARNMDGVQGNLFDVVTWLKHTVHSLRRRGILHGVANTTVGLEPAFAILRSMPTGLLERFVEACYLDKKAGFEHLDLESIAIPGSYWSTKEIQTQQPKKICQGVPHTQTLHDDIEIPASDKPTAKLPVTDTTSTKEDVSPVDAPWSVDKETQSNSGVPLTEERRQDTLRHRSNCVNPLASDTNDEVGVSDLMEEE